MLHARKWARVGGWVGGQCAQQPFFEHAKALAEYAHKYLHPEHEPSFVLPTYFLFNRIVEVLKEF